jgi:hypothetical protein
VEHEIGWLIDHQPTMYAPILVHGDPQISNIMYRDGKLAAMLDWERSYLGSHRSGRGLPLYAERDNSGDGQACGGYPERSGVSHPL